MPGGQIERDEKVSLELTDEIVRSMEVGSVFRDYNCKISSMDFHKASNHLVTASDDESIRLYDAANAMCLKTINSKKYGVDLVCFTSHPTTVIYSSKNGWDESLRLLSLHDNKYLRYFKGHHDRVVSISLCPRSECFISGSLDRTVLLWDQRSDKCQGLLRLQGRPAVSYDEMGMVFAIAYGGHIRMFDVRKYEKGPFEIFAAGDQSEANVLEFSLDGRLMLLTTTAGHIYVLDSCLFFLQLSWLLDWFLKNISCQHVALLFSSQINSFNVKAVSSEATLDASFSPDGLYIVSGSGDGSVTAWNIRSGKEICSWVSTEFDPPVIKWSPGSLTFASGSTELSLWVPDLAKIESFAGGK